MTYARTNTPKLPDEEVLALIRSGHIVVRLEEFSGERLIEVWKWHASRRRYERLKAHCYDDPPRWRYHLRIGGAAVRNRTIYRNKLVWLSTKRENVPAGHVIDHADQDPENDWPDNLRLMTFKESDAQGRRLQWSMATPDEREVMKEEF